MLDWVNQWVKQDNPLMTNVHLNKTMHDTINCVNINKYKEINWLFLLFWYYIFIYFFFIQNQIAFWSIRDKNGRKQLNLNKILYFSIIFATLLTLYSVCIVYVCRSNKSPLFYPLYDEKNTVFWHDFSEYPTKQGIY